MEAESGLPVLRLGHPDQPGPKRITKVIAAEADHDQVDLFLMGLDGFVVVRGTRSQLVRLLGRAVVEVGGVWLSLSRRLEL